MFENYTERARDVLSVSQDILRRYKQTQLDAEHILLALLEQEDGLVPQVIGRIGPDIRDVIRRVEEELARIPKVYTSERSAEAQIYITPRGKRVLDFAEQEAKRLKDEYVGVEHLLLGIIKEGESAASRILAQFHVDEERVYRALQQIRGNQRVDSENPESKHQMLAKYARDLTALARDGKIDPVIGRDEEITRVVQVLSRRTKNNPVLIGDPGVGKTAIAEDRRGRCAGDAEGTHAAGPRPRRDGRREQVPGRVRGAVEGRHGRGKEGGGAGRSLYRRTAYRCRCGRGGRRDGRFQYAETGPCAWRTAMYWRNDPR
jgi:ATP-dependent Clp protease ATP-binding subunit ClpA